jgi:hypothetical protein
VNIRIFQIPLTALNKSLPDRYNVFYEFNNICPQLMSTNEYNMYKIKLLHITLSKKQNSIQFAIFQIPNTTESIISNDLCHPNEHKQSTNRYLVNRMNSYPINNWKIKQTTLDLEYTFYYHYTNILNTFTTSLQT